MKAPTHRGVRLLEAGDWVPAGLLEQAKVDAALVRGTHLCDVGVYVLVTAAADASGARLRARTFGDWLIRCSLDGVVGDEYTPFADVRR